MDYESEGYECDIWQNVVVITRKSDKACGSICLKQNGKVATSRMIKSDIKKHGIEKTLSVWAKLVKTWE